MAAPPNAFSGHLEKWILDSTKASIFFVNIMPREGTYDEIEGLMETAEVPEDDRPGLLDGTGYSSTGFVVQEGPVFIKILTCAHTVDHVFNAQHPLSRNDAHRLFSAHVLCDHGESSFRLQGQDIHHERAYAQGDIIGINCLEDLMLIRVRRDEVMDLDHICIRNHPPLRFSLTPPVALDECVMVSWPSSRQRTCVKGRVSHVSRSFNDLDVDNPIGYQINLMEVDIASENGSSGAPLMNGNGKVISFLHGGFGGRFSFFVCLDTIIHFLTLGGVRFRQD